MARPIFDPRMMDRLEDFFPLTCTIQEYTETIDPVYHEIIMKWIDLADHVDLPCSKAPGGGREVLRPNQTYVVVNHIISMPKPYPLIDEKMRAVIGGVNYSIELAHIDSHSKTTRLMANVVK